MASSSRSDALLGIVQLLRPLNFVLFLAGVALGGVLGAGAEAFESGSGRALVWAMASAACLGGAANAINDVYDLAIDRVNRPGRPLPSGTVSVRAATWTGVSLAVLSVLLAAGVSRTHVLLAVTTAGLLWLYSASLKRKPVVGNLAVSLVLALALVYGGLAVGLSEAVLVGAAFAFLTTWAREGAKDLEDVEGDAAEGARTLPLVTSPRTAAWVCLGVLTATLAFLPVPAFVPALGLPFLAFGLPAAGLLLAAVWHLLAPDPTATAGQASALLKAAMVAGVVALACARLA
ncbi:MAG: geranylgeranylglycerol-phosphate geranylgeranyltransferase [Bacteroidota bacterium]